MSDNIFYSFKPEDFFYTAVNIPCQSACPAKTNIPSYIRALYENDYDKSYEINRQANILPGVLGRICSRPCENSCRHGEAELGEPVNICHIKRSAFDYSTGEHKNEKPGRFVEKKVAIIGSGPSGLAAAHDLAATGIGVTIYEALKLPGGMLRYGIPEFRLPRDVLDREIRAVVDLGIDLKTGVRVGKDISLETLQNSYDALLVATGCYRPIPLNVPGETINGVFSGLNFMMDICSNVTPEIGETVLVIGAGFTAFDCARSALRLGALDVSICLRRTEEDLSVTHDEVMETKKEGVKIRSLMLSKEIIGGEGVSGVEFVRTMPGDKRPDGKRHVTPIEGSEFVLPADTVIVATGQKPGPFDLPKKTEFSETDDFKTSAKGIYVAGDYMTGPSTVIESIAMGRNAACQIAHDLVGEPLTKKAVRMENVETTDRQRSWDFIPRQEISTVRPVEKRIHNPTLEVETGLSRDTAFRESKRCYLCYLHYEIDMDRCIYCRYCIDVAPRDCIKLVRDIEINQDGAVTGYRETDVWQDVNAVIIDNSRCIRCGECLRVCPVECISVTKVELVDKPAGGFYG